MNYGQKWCRYWAEILLSHKMDFHWLNNRGNQQKMMLKEMKNFKSFLMLSIKYKMPLMFRQHLQVLIHPYIPILTNKLRNISNQNRFSKLKILSKYPPHHKIFLNKLPKVIKMLISRNQWIQWLPMKSEEEDFLKFRKFPNQKNQKMPTFTLYKKICKKCMIIINLYPEMK